jgi:hypothetical protein
MQERQETRREKEQAMRSRKFLRALWLCVLLAVLAVLFVDEAYAADPDVMEKKGIEGLFAGKGGDDERAPTPAQKWLGIGSIGVMIVVVKYL